MPYTTNIILKEVNLCETDFYQPCCPFVWYCLCYQGQRGQQQIIPIAKSTRTTQLFFIFNGHQYLRIDQGMTWLEAKAYCERLGGHLVTITSKEEQAAVEPLIEKGTQNQYWLGAQRVDHNDVNSWKWVTDEPWSYTNWSYCEPTNHKNSEFYLQMYRLNNPHLSDQNPLGKWNDITVDNYVSGETDFFITDKVGILCEWDNVERLFNISVEEPDKYVYAKGLFWNNFNQCSSIPAKITVKNLANTTVEDVKLALFISSPHKGIYFNNNEEVYRAEISQMAAHESKIIDVNIQLDANAFDKNSGGKKQSLEITPFIEDKYENVLCEGEPFAVNIEYWFDFGTDNFSFINEKTAFCDLSNGEKEKYYISKEAKRKIKIEHYVDIWAVQDLCNIPGWKGSCFGMSSTASSIFTDQISSKQFGGVTTNEINKPIKNTLLRDAINILQCSTTTLTYMSNRSLFTSQETLREQLVNFMKETQDNNMLPVLEFKINIDGNHAVMPYSISENGNDYIIWVYDPNELQPQKMTIGTDYKSITYKGSNNVKIINIVTDPEVININTYAPGLIGSDASTVNLLASEYYDFTAVILDTSSAITITNDKNQTLTIKGDEVINGDIEIISIDHIANMDERFALLLLKNDSSNRQNLKIRSNENGEIIAVINNNHNVGYIHTSGDSHIAEYSSDGKVAVVSDGKIEGDISYSNPMLVKDTDIFGVRLSGDDTSTMSIKTDNGAVQVNSDNLSNLKLTATRKNEEYYETDFSLSNTEHLSNNVEITKSNTDAVLNISTDNNGIYNEIYTPIWSITPLEDITSGDEISAVANIDDDCELILALYNAEGKLVNVATEVYAGNTSRKEICLRIPEDINLSGYHVKAFILDSLNGMKPLADSVEIEL